MANSPLLLDLPTEITTERLRLRVPRFGDGPLVFESVRASLPELKRWMPWATDAYDLAEAEQWCRRSAARFLSREELAFRIFLADGTYIGCTSLFAIDWTIPKCEIGYWLATAYRGQGYMTEAVGVLTQYAQQHLSAVRIEILSDAANLRSRRVAERSGYALEATLRKSRRNTAGELCDGCVYAMTT